MLPPKMLWWCLLFCSKSYLLFAASLSSFGQTERLLSLFYPQQTLLYVGLLIGLPAVVVFACIGFKEALWRNLGHAWPRLIKPTIALSLLGQLLVLGISAAQQRWSFSWAVGVGMLTSMILLYWLLKSRHLRIMISDWQTATPR